MAKECPLTVILEEKVENGERWDKLHQCLLMLFDSPLNHAGLMSVYVRLANGKFIKMHPEIRIPRTFKRFEQLFVNFLQGCDMPVVQTKDGPTRLLELVSKTVEKQLMLSKNFRRYRIVNLISRLRDPDSFASDCSDKSAIGTVLIIEFGPVDFNFLGNGKESEYEIKTINRNLTDEMYSISRYPLAASLMCVKLVTAFEEALDVW